MFTPSPCCCSTLAVILFARSARGLSLSSSSASDHEGVPSMSLSYDDDDDGGATGKDTRLALSAATQEAANTRPASPFMGFSERVLFSNAGLSKYMILPFKPYRTTQTKRRTRIPRHHHHFKKNANRRRRRKRRCLPGEVVWFHRPGGVRQEKDSSSSSETPGIRCTTTTATAMLHTGSQDATAER